MFTTKQISKTITAAMVAVLLTGTSAVYAQVKIGTNPTAIGASSNLEIEASNNKKTISDKTTGTFKVENKPTAAKTDSVVMRDPAGELHQISAKRLLETQNVATTVFEGILSVSQPIPIIVTQNSLDQRMPLTPRPGYSAGWDATNKRFTLPADGYYHIEVGLGCIGTGPGGASSLVTRIWISSMGGGPFDYSYAPISSAYGVWGSQVWSGQFTAGTTISLDGYISQRDPGTSYPAVCSAGYMNITRVN